MRGVKVTSESVRKDGMRVGGREVGIVVTWSERRLRDSGYSGLGVKVGVSGEVQDFASLRNRRSSSGDQ
jgi:hypothetical protein